jgi:cytochrome c556
MHCLCWTMISAAGLMTLLGGYANRSDAAGNTPIRQAAAKMTDEDYRAIMKKVGRLYPSMRKNLDRGETIQVVKEAQQLGELFGDVEKFWTQETRPDAVKWAQKARTVATQIAADVTAVEGYRRSDGRIQSGIQLRLKRARTAVTNLGAVCKECHSTYREGDEDTGFRIKRRGVPLAGAIRQ